MSIRKMLPRFTFPLLLVSAVALGASLVAAEPTAATGGGKEVREFEILLKGKPTGTSKITIEQLPGQRTFVTVDCSVEVNVVVYVYRYNFHGTQTWQADRLEKFDSTTVDGGKKSSTTGVVTADRLDMVVNNQRRSGPAPAMTTDYWQLPLQRAAGGVIPAVDATTGAAKMVRVSRAADTKVQLAGTAIPCTEYRLAGDVDARVWLDAGGRVVRQQSVEDGHATEMRLTRIYRTDLAATPAPLKK